MAGRVERLPLGLDRGRVESNGPEQLGPCLPRTERRAGAGSDSGRQRATEGGTPPTEGGIAVGRQHGRCGQMGRPTLNRHHTRAGLLGGAGPPGRVREGPAPRAVRSELHGLGLLQRAASFRRSGPKQGADTVAHQGHQRPKMQKAEENGRKTSPAQIRFDQNAGEADEDKQHTACHESQSDLLSHAEEKRNPRSAAAPAEASMETSPRPPPLRGLLAGLVSPVPGLLLGGQHEPRHAQAYAPKRQPPE